LAGGALRVGTAQGQELSAVTLGKPADSSNTDELKQSSRGSSVEVEVVGPARVTSGLPIAITLVVRNNGSKPIAGVRVEAATPGGAQVRSDNANVFIGNDRFTWDLGEMKADSERRLEMELGTNGQDLVELRPEVRFNAPTGLRTTVDPSPLELSVQNAKEAVPGEKVAFDVHVGNHLAETIQAVVVQVKLPKGLSHPEGNFIEASVGALAAGETKSLHLETTAAAVGKQAGEFIAATAGKKLTSAKVEIEVQNNTIELQLNGPNRANVEDEVVYRLQATNSGGRSVGDVLIEQALPEGLDFVRASTSGSFDRDKKTVNWRLGEMKAGEKQVLTVTARGRSAGEWSVSAVARGLGAPEVRATSATHLDAAPSLALEVRALDLALTVEGETTYEVRLVNEGTGAATVLSLKALIPAGLSLLRADGPAKARVSGQSVQFEPLATLEPREEVMYRLRIKGATAGNWKTNFELLQDDRPIRGAQREATTVVRPKERMVAKKSTPLG
jgi:uncharacterized repeat protein (TIGR01451 family)